MQDSNYRALYGKLFSALLSKFGGQFVTEIEDSIQNAFLKSLKIWSLEEKPNQLDNWLFIVARNDLMNQIKIKAFDHAALFPDSDESEGIGGFDLRLQTIIFIASLGNISNKAKVLIILKNIFGLSIKEISESTLIEQEAIYKHVQRAKKSIEQTFHKKIIDLESIKHSEGAISIVEELLYGVFNLGFDSFSEKSESIVNEDLCLEAFALTKLFYAQTNRESTSNLLALFCFHIARIPAKVDNGKLISFFKQNREKWNKDFMNVGFQYLKQEKHLGKLYIEAIIISKYMTISNFTQKDWQDIVQLYEIIMKLTNSPIVILNYCYCLSQIGKHDDAFKLLETLETELPSDHIYFSLVKATLLKEYNPDASASIFTTILDGLHQNIRKEYLLENEFIKFN
jgi:RNA polymerase sigma-70 factor (ECF subfamily)